ncbi:MAG: flavin reductase family protein [Saprospiraceae bacterium]
MHKHFTPEAIADMPRFERANFVNSLSGFKSAHLIGTADPSGRLNLGFFHNVVHLGADPALIGYVNRPREAAPHTLGNIEQTGCYTMNAVPAPMTLAAHQCSAKYPAEISEFDAVGLQPLMREGILAPFVADSPVQYALQLVEIAPIRHNGTFLVIGRLVGAWVREDLIEPDGFIAFERAELVASIGLDGYYRPMPIARLPYARP